MALCCMIDFSIGLLTDAMYLFYVYPKLHCVYMNGMLLWMWLLHVITVYI